MKFKTAPDDPDSGWFHRRVSENGIVHFGVYRVMYGWRVRAGFTSDTSGCTLDWCGGGNWDDVQRLYSLCQAVLSHREEEAFCFDGVPSRSNVKPFYYDDEFLGVVAELAGPDFEMITLERPTSNLPIPTQPIIPWEKINETQ